MMKTLVTGSTGFLGSAILRELLDDGREVKVLVRKDTDTTNIDGLDVEIAYGDLRDSESLQSASNGCDILYHTAACYSLWDQDKQLIYDINVEGTRKILQAAQNKKVWNESYTRVLWGASDSMTTPLRQMKILPSTQTLYPTTIKNPSTSGRASGFRVCP